MNQLRLRAEQLLLLHEGHCFVVAGNELTQSFQDMEREGFVTITPCGHIAGIDVKAIDYQPHPVIDLEPETPAH